ncbi:MAG: serine hydrolase [Bacteroidetes bacterium]|nr:serine hydrolase [Bacteroidota bacterium]
MKILVPAFLLLLSFGKTHAQSLYFPPLTGNTWETLSPDSLGWCPDKIEDLYDLLETNNSKAFLLLKDGRIVLEKYFGTFTQDSAWYWASAGKSMTACLVGIAQQDGLLDIDDRTSDYLGTGWTACPPDKEDLITVRHQLTMTTGLDDGVPDNYCTLDTCLQYLADAGTRWAYHNAPYTLLDGVIENATGQNFNQYFSQKISQKTGISGIWLPSGYNNILFSKARSMARFGILIQNGGTWNTTPVLTDPDYVQQMLNTSQGLNQSYGYLWWLNGKPSFMLPGLQIVFPLSLFPAAPPDVVAALGKNGQYVNVSPSTGLVMVRMGNAPGSDSEVPAAFANDIWLKINDLACEPSGTFTQKNEMEPLVLYPNPVGDLVQIDGPESNADFTVEVFDGLGRCIFSGENYRQLEVSGYGSGLHHVVVQQVGRKWIGRFFVK